jgi:hypothetical protein
MSLMNQGKLHLTHRKHFSAANGVKQHPSIGDTLTQCSPQFFLFYRRDAFAVELC